MPICPTCRTACDDGVARCPVDGTALGPADPLLGKILGDRYRLLARIGEGGMGTVYRAEHVVLRKRMAVKVLRPELSEDEDLVRRFQQEAIAASQIGQENIVAVTDFGRTSQGALYFVMEELDGVSLAALLHEGGPLPVERAVVILAQVCRALGAAHGRGIVHRDLKPDNVIVLRREDGSDFVKVVDFGIAKDGARPEQGRLTRAGTIIGTPEYMAPEQAAASAVDHRADVYAFGVLAYELLTGRLPFRGDTAIATLLEHQTRAPVPPGQLRQGLPAALEALVLAALAKRPEARPQTMAAVAAELTPVLASFGLPPVYDRPPTPPPMVLGAPTRRLSTPRAPGIDTPRGGTLALETGPAQRTTLPLPRRSRIAPRRGRLAVAGVLGMAVVVVAAAALSWRAGSRRGAAVPAAVSPAAPSAAASGAAQPSSAAAPAEAVPAAQAAAPTTPLPTSPAAAERAAPPRRTASAASPTPRRTAAAGERKAGRQGGSEDNPYRKLEDLKPDPL